MLRGALFVVALLAVIGAIAFVPEVGGSDRLGGGPSNRRRAAGGTLAAFWVLALAIATVARERLGLAPAARIGSQVGAGLTFGHPFGTDALGRDVLASVGDGPRFAAARRRGDARRDDSRVPRSACSWALQAVGSSGSVSRSSPDGLRSPARSSRWCSCVQRPRRLAGHVRVRRGGSARYRLRGSATDARRAAPVGRCARIGRVAPRRRRTRRGRGCCAPRSRRRSSAHRVSSSPSSLPACSGSGRRRRRPGVTRSRRSFSSRPACAGAVLAPVGVGLVTAVALAALGNAIRPARVAARAVAP